jgi:hypothetical protein
LMGSAKDIIPVMVRRAVHRIQLVTRAAKILVVGTVKTGKNIWRIVCQVDVMIVVCILTSLS